MKFLGSPSKRRKRRAIALKAFITGCERVRGGGLKGFFRFFRNNLGKWDIAHMQRRHGVDRPIR